MHRRWLVGTATALVVAGASGCGGGGGSDGNGTPVTGPPPAPNTVAVRNNAFAPGSMSVSAGTTVTWMWDSCTNDPYGGTSSCVSHSVTFDGAGAPSSPTQSSGSWAHAFATRGTYAYHCVIHGTAMSGTITVQ